MHSNIVEIFLVIEVFKLNNRMVGPMNSVRVYLEQEQ